MFYVYILASKPYGTLYVGSTCDLVKRVWQHKGAFVKSFTSKYKIYFLIYYEIHATYEAAARREKRLKNWCRQWKVELIIKSNPKWRDLYDDICQ